MCILRPKQSIKIILQLALQLVFFTNATFFSNNFRCYHISSEPLFTRLFDPFLAYNDRWENDIVH